MMPARGAQLELEVEARKSEERERELVQRALEAERRTADAMRAEATAAEEAAAAERAAKFAADSEARELQREMEGLQEALRCVWSFILDRPLGYQVLCAACIPMQPGTMLVNVMPQWLYLASLATL